MSACPVGLAWPVDVGFEKFQDSIANRTNVHFSGLLHLLRTRRTVIEKWFHQVQRHYDAFSVPVNSALPLIQAFPVDDDHPGDDILDVSLLAPFQEQLDRFLRTQVQ